MADKQQPQMTQRRALALAVMAVNEVARGNQDVYDWRQAEKQLRAMLKQTRESPGAVLSDDRTQGYLNRVESP